MISPVAIVFDLDWTLYDADSFYNQAWSRVCARVSSESGVDSRLLSQALEGVWKTEGPSCPDLFDRWLRHVDLPQEPWVQVAVEVLHGEWPLALSPYAGVPRLLGGFSDVSMGLLTEGRARTQRRKVEALGLERFFDAILVSEEVGASKRTGRPYQEMCHRLGVAPTQTFSIGDRFDSDIAPASALGAATCLVRQGPFALSHSRELADWYVEEITVLAPVVHDWLARI